MKKAYGRRVFTGPGLAQRGVIVVYRSANRENFQQPPVHPRTRCGRQKKRRRWTAMAMSYLAHLVHQKEVNYEQ